MKMNLFCRSVLSALTMLSSTAFAESATLRIPNQILSSRTGSLGGAFTAVADDQNALYFNPAGLALIDETFFAIADIELAASVGSGGLSSLTDDVSKAIELAKEVAAAKGDLVKQIDKSSEFAKLLSSRTAFVSPNYNLYYARHRWGFSLNARNAIGVGVHGNILPEIADVGFYTDIDARVAYAHPFLDGRVNLGIAPYMRMRAQAGAANLSVSDVVDTDSALKAPQIGNGLGMDVGLMVRPVKTMSPTFGLAIVNVGDTRLKLAKDSALAKSALFAGKEIMAAEPLKQVVNAGFSITPVDGPAFVRLAAELREINRPTAAELKPAGSVEAGFRSSLVRTTAALGWGNGGWSAGFEARLFVKLRLASYIEPNLLFDRRENQRVWVLSVGI